MLFHWLASVIVMFVVTTLVLEPATIVFHEVVWCALVHSAAQRYGYGPYALSATLQYRDAVRQIEQLFFRVLRVLGAIRLQRWWRAVLSMYRAIHEQTLSAIKIQSIRKRQIARKKYGIARNWCLKLELLKGRNFPQVELEGHMNPLVRIVCDEGNPRVLESAVCWSGGANPAFDETFHIDTKEVSKIYVTAWSRDLQKEEFIGRGVINVKSAQSGRVDLPLYNLKLGDVPKPGMEKFGELVCVLTYLDPLKTTGDTGWMLPRHRMQFVMSRVGGNLTIGKMLGAFGPKDGSKGPPEAPPETSQLVSLTSVAEGAKESALPGQVEPAAEAPA